MPATAPIRIGKVTDDDSYFEEELNKAPEDHFLSPIQMHEYEDWDSDSDGGEEVEWDAGITDFALFNNDRRRAQERQENVPDRWNHLLASQASALQRATQRSRSDSDPSLEEMPQLTPDNSPSLRDAFDMDSHFKTFGHKPQSAPRPNFLDFRPTRTTKYEMDDASDDSDFDDSEDEDDADLPLSVIMQRAKERQHAARMQERPGLRFSRTLSGKQHVWRRPSHEIYPLNEDVAGERKAEHDYYHHDETTTEHSGPR
ncbi:uncharacterized protein RCC_10902 [Ramularia collo-cygni]|uniref:Uncharacterized protein n=1 Tax=Ramularia collo-cygni TaxID=112498 RepID=A0A2D3VAS3_9PEZI|nr:uncharacterized protein RCC_10902 [Ramularia collo-cygni]CZT25173.1 uncharacterized protein RCC_10902 [Ramularia collo-cygni]